MFWDTRNETVYIVGLPEITFSDHWRSSLRIIIR